MAARVGAEAGEPPEVAAKALPEWYRLADRYDANKDSTYRNCMPFFDAMTSGYMFKTPCDVTFFHDGTRIMSKIDDPLFQNFVNPRGIMEQFYHPENFYPDHFAFMPQWGVGVEEGYSALYVTPLNQFHLPFVIASGIIDNDKINTPGMVPFFVKQGFHGVIPKGTPYMQVIPFKRDVWEATTIYGTPEQVGRNLKRSLKFRSVKSDFYRDHIWQRKKYRTPDSVNFEDNEGDDNG